VFENWSFKQPVYIQYQQTKELCCHLAGIFSMIMLRIAKIWQQLRQLKRVHSNVGITVPTFAEKIAFTQ
jgi:hypothetical protein